MFRSFTSLCSLTSAVRVRVRVCVFVCVRAGGWILIGAVDQHHLCLWFGHISGWFCQAF